MIVAINIRALVSGFYSKYDCVFLSCLTVASARFTFILRWSGKKKQTFTHFEDPCSFNVFADGRFAFRVTLGGEPLICDASPKSGSLRAGCCSSYPTRHYLQHQNKLFSSKHLASDVSVVAFLMQILSNHLFFFFSRPSVEKSSWTIKKTR